MEAIALRGFTGAIANRYSAGVVTVGENIARVRELTGLSQAQLADKLHVRQPVIAKLETSKGLPKSGTLLRLAVALTCSVEDLLQGVDVEYTHTRELLSNPASTHRGHQAFHRGITVDITSHARLAELQARAEEFDRFVERIEEARVLIAEAVGDYKTARSRTTLRKSRTPGGRTTKHRRSS